MTTEREAQLRIDRMQEPDPDDHNWREIPQGREPLEGPELYDDIMEILKYERGKNREG